MELHSIFLQTLMDFDGNQPIRILFWNDEMMLTKQKHMIYKFVRSLFKKGVWYSRKTLLSETNARKLFANRRGQTIF
jgi:hypothetical protein